MMNKGTVKKLIKDRGFGFIRSNDGREIFFHRSGVDENRFDDLTEGENVEFDVEKGPRGLKATNVKISGE